MKHCKHKGFLFLVGVILFSLNFNIVYASDKEDQEKLEILARSNPDPLSKLTNQSDFENEFSNGSRAAAIELAKGYLGLSDRLYPKISINKDVEKGFDILKKLSNQGDIDATYLAASGYMEHPNAKVDESFFKDFPNISSELTTLSREELNARTAVSAASRGSLEATSALVRAGEQGSASAYYALGRLYMLDRRKVMPVSRRFVTRRLNLRRRAGVRSRGFRGFTLGSHFLSRASRMGHPGAKSLISGLGVKSSLRPGSSRGTGSSSSFGRGLASGLGKMSSSGLESLVSNANSSSSQQGNQSNTASSSTSQAARQSARSNNEKASTQAVQKSSQKSGTGSGNASVATSATNSGSVYKTTSNKNLQSGSGNSKKGSPSKEIEIVD